MDAGFASLMGFVAGMVLMYLFSSTTSTARLERKLDMLLRNSGIDFPSAATAEARALVKAGKKIEAIKAYREITGCGLAEAKSRVESLQ
jgi:hypothetical protein